MSARPQHLAVPAPGSSGVPASVADLAKGALRRLARAQLEPTPENYARAYAQEAGTRNEEAAPAITPAAVEQQLKAVGQVWAGFSERMCNNLGNASRQWTPGRRRESLRRVFEGGRADPVRLLQRLQALMKAWEEDQAPEKANELAEELHGIPEAGLTAPAPLSNFLPLAEPAAAATAWPVVVGQLESTVRAGLPKQEGAALALADRLALAAQALASEGAHAQNVAHIEALCVQARQFLGQRHQLVEQLGKLCLELTSGMADMVESGGWVQGQCQAVMECLRSEDGGAPSLRAVRGASALLAEARRRQNGVQGERVAAQTALKSLIQNMLLEVGELGEHTGRFQDATAAHVEAIENASSMESLAGVVKSLLADSRAVQAAVQASSTRLNADRDRASELETRVRDLEGELRRLSEEVSTDALTKVANRRGLAQIFEVECARQLREGGPGLSVGLIDIDNFKKLNDTLGHAAGDQALQNLAAQVQARLRPIDHIARFGGEEFVVLIPGTAAADAQQALTRLQRNLTEALFLHEGREVFVTFSGGVTLWQEGESLEDALARADAAMYEAKRAGKNRTCVS